MAWVLSRGPAVVFKMAARDPKGSVCSLMGLSGEIRKRMSVIDTGIWRDMRVNAVNMCWLIKSVHSCSLGAHGVLLVKLSHLVEEPNLSHPSHLIRLSAVSPVNVRTWSAQRARGLPSGSAVVHICGVPRLLAQ